MNRHDLVLLVCGLTDPAHVAEVRAMAARARRQVLIAAAPLPPGDSAFGVSCLDLTAHLDFDAAIAACRGSAKQGGLVFVQEYQLRHDGVAEAIRHLDLRCIALETDVTHDTDPSWVVARAERAQSAVDLAYYAIDIFADVVDSWRFLDSQTEPEGFRPSDLRDLCARFPVLLSADIDAANVAEVAAFPGAAGVFLTCDELRPTLPADRHVLSFAALREVLEVLLADGRSAG